MPTLRLLSRGAWAAAVTLTLLLASAGNGIAAEAPASEKAAAPAPGKKLDLNAATEAQLIELPKVGPALAKRILEYRKQVGTIKTLDELVNVQGIGEKTLEILKPHVTVSSQSKS